MPREIRIGLAGWSNPPGAQKKRAASASHLSHYASEFSCVEVNSSFSREHRPATYARWREDTPACFRFAVKMPCSITHEAQLRGCRSEIQGFIAAVSELKPKLTAVLFQLPPSLVFDRRTVTSFFDRLPRLEDVHLVCEPRHCSWFADGVAAHLNALGVSRAAADPVRCSGADRPAPCGDFAYFRWHGSPEIYYSSYSDADLSSFAQMVKSLAVKEIWCIFDNTARYAAWPNAQLFRALTDTKADPARTAQVPLGCADRKIEHADRIRDTNGQSQRFRGYDRSMRIFMFGSLLAVTMWSSREAIGEDSAADLYQRDCAQCHGAELQGAQGPALVGRDDIGLKSNGDLTRIVREGIPANGMPAWSSTLSEYEIASLVQFIKKHRADDATEHLKLLDKQSLRALPRTVIHTDQQTFRVELIAEPEKPTGIAVLPDGRLLISQERGGLRLVEKSGMVAEAIAGVPPCEPKDFFHRVLLGVAVHPKYRQNGWIYLTCGDSVTDAAGKATTDVVLFRGRLRAHAWVDSEILVRIPTSSSVGAPIACDDEGHLFLSTTSAAGLGTGPDSKVLGDGPRATADLLATPPQDLTSPNGKILRFDDRGAIPPDNPFVRSPNAYGPIWSLGIRNAAGMAFDRATGHLWATDHGPRGGDKINQIKEGHNYGWPVISYGTRYDGIAFTKDTERPGMDQPLINWTPDIGVSAVAVYRGTAFPRWNGNLLVGSLVKQDLLRVGVTDDSVVVQEVLLPHLGRIRALAVGPHGEIFAALELRQQGAIVRLVP